MVHKLKIDIGDYGVFFKRFGDGDSSFVPDLVDFGFLKSEMQKHDVLWIERRLRSTIDLFSFSASAMYLAPSFPILLPVV